MKIAYMPDTHFGSYDQVNEPKSSEVADAMQHCLDEAVLAERVGFDGIWVPERHQRKANNHCRGVQIYCLNRWGYQGHSCYATTGACKKSKIKLGCEKE